MKDELELLYLSGLLHDRRAFRRTFQVPALAVLMDEETCRDHWTHAGQQRPPVFFQVPKQYARDREVPGPYRLGRAGGTDLVYALRFGDVDLVGGKAVDARDPEITVFAEGNSVVRRDRCV